MTDGMLTVLWLIAAVALFVVESLTVQMICIWFAVGAVFAMLAALLGAPLGAQLLVFLLASVAFLVAVRPYMKKRLIKDRVATNADQVIGQTAVVKEDIDNVRQTGRVLANGLDWTARTDHDELLIPADSRVTVLRIEGVKLIVEPAKTVAQVKE